MADIIAEVRGRVGFLTLNREEKQNSLTSEVLTGILAALDAWEGNPAVGVVCIQGAGKAFCAGADLSGMKNMADAMTETRKFAQMIKRLYAYPKPTVAAVNGVCMGGGMGIMLACDISLVNEEAVFATPEVNVGLFPLIISPLIFQNIKSEKVANEIMFSGRRVSAREASELGLTSRVFSAQEFSGQVETFLQHLSQKSAQVLGFGKLAIGRAKDLPFETAVDALCKDLGVLLQTEDAQEGVAAFMQKRKPVFRNRS